MGYYGGKIMSLYKRLPMQALVAPDNFNPDAQEINIVDKYASYLELNESAKYIFSVSSLVTSTTLTTGTGISFRYGETISGVEFQYDTSASTINWTSGSSKRWVITNNTASSMVVTIPTQTGAIWCYCGDFSITSIGTPTTQAGSYLKYIHCFDIHKVLAIGDLWISNFVGATVIIPSSCVTASKIANNGTFSKLIIEDGVKNIGSYCFYQCNGIQTINGISITEGLTLPESILSLGNNSFNSVYGLAGTCYVGANVNSIGLNALYSNFTMINISPSNPYYCNVSGIVYNKAKTQMITIAFRYAGELAVENTCTSIRYWDCSGGSLITRLTLPASLSTFGNQSFLYCSGLTRIDNYRVTPTATNPAFPTAIKTTCVLHVPVGSLSAYQASAYWNTFTNIIADL